MLSTRLVIPRHLVDGIKPNDRGARVDKIIYGADSETVHGVPNSLQFYSEDVVCEDIFFVNDTSSRRRFIQWCDKRRRNCQHVVYVHVLDFDLVSFLWGQHAKLNTASGDFNFTVGRWTIRGVYGSPTFCRLSDGAHTSIYFVDSFSFFRGSLAKAAKIFCPNLPKLPRLAGLGERRFTSRDNVFCAYAMRDAEIAYHIGKAIEGLHQEYDLQQCYSVAHLAERIFRHRFLGYTIPQPSRDCIEAALLSYHGGKNNVTVAAGWYDGVRSLDISSAYPHAMHEMPAFSNPRAYKRIRIRVSATRAVSLAYPYGVYRLRGTVANCAWPSLFSHGFKSLRGAIEGVYVSGFELAESLRAGEFTPKGTISGWIYDTDKDPQAPAMRAFVDDFYAKKERETDKVLKYMYKLILNSISGKFIQTRKRGVCAFTDIDAGVTVSAAELEAGGMFHPFIASSITAHTRARIHRLEHQYSAIHTATDGIFTQSNAKLPRESGLGALTQDHAGTLLLIRNKCYVLYTDERTDTKSAAFKGKYIAKEARHGFQGKVADLERLIATGRRTYTVNKPWRLKEALKRGKTPNEFREQSYTLKVGPLPIA